MAHNVKCMICGKVFDRDKEPFEKVTSRRYAHKECCLNPEKNQSDRSKLDQYICELFGYSFVPPNVQMQIKEYVEDYKYSEIGILNTLKYFYEIKKGDIVKAKGGIGIVAYVYTEANIYFEKINSANEKNSLIEIFFEDKEVNIYSQDRKPMKRKIFSFLDEDGEND